MATAFDIEPICGNRMTNSSPSRRLIEADDGVYPKRFLEFNGHFRDAIVFNHNLTVFLRSTLEHPVYHAAKSREVSPGNKTAKSRPPFEMRYINREHSG